MAGAGVGDPTILKAFTMLQSVLSYAVVEGKIQVNPAREVKKPGQMRDREIRPVALERVEALRGRLSATARTPRARSMIWRQWHKSTAR